MVLRERRIVHYLGDRSDEREWSGPSSTTIYLSACSGERLARHPYSQEDHEGLAEHAVQAVRS